MFELQWTKRFFTGQRNFFFMKKYIVFGSKRLFVLEQEFIFTFDKDLFTGVSTVGRTRKISKRCKEKRSTVPEFLITQSHTHTLSNVYVHTEHDNFLSGGFCV